jgi:hypothetical protein
MLSEIFDKSTIYITSDRPHHFSTVYGRKSHSTNMIHPIIVQQSLNLLIQK